MLSEKLKKTKRRLSTIPGSMPENYGRINVIIPLNGKIKMFCQKPIFGDEIILLPRKSTAKRFQMM